MSTPPRHRPPAAKRSSAVRFDTEHGAPGPYQGPVPTGDSDAKSAKDNTCFPTEADFPDSISLARLSLFSRAMATLASISLAPKLPGEGTGDPQRRAFELLADEGVETSQPVVCVQNASLGLNNLPGGAGETLTRDGLATALMNLFRCSRSREVFDTLVELTQDQLEARVRARTRGIGPSVDPLELLQDTFISIYSYPDRFDASDPNAFRAWSSTIVDNAVRRYLRKSRSGPNIRLSPMEILAEEPEPGAGPVGLAIHGEESRSLQKTFGFFLLLYMRAYQELSDRERYVLQRVEIDGVRYAQLAEELGVRPEALKMVVYRARQRIAKSIHALTISR